MLKIRYSVIRVKILVLASRFPFPLEKGDKLRLYHQIRELSQKHEIVLCALSECTVQDIDYQAVKPFCSRIFILPLSKFTVVKNIIFNVLKGILLPFQVAYFYDKNIKKQINDIIDSEKPDHIYTQLARMAEYARHKKLPKTLDFMDAFSKGAERRAISSNNWVRPFWQLEARKMAEYEASIALDFDRLTIISEQDRDTLVLNNKTCVKIVPNGVDINYFKKTLPPQYPTPTEHFDIAFIGNLGYYPNVEAAKYLVKRIFPLVLKELPNVKILLSGARPTHEILNLRSKNVTVKGWIEDIREAYNQATILAAPLFNGSGQQNKILEAMAMEVPCVTTSLVNQAILAVENEEILVANNEIQFAESIILLLKNTEFRHKISKNARILVKNKYSWKVGIED